MPLKTTESAPTEPQLVLAKNNPLVPTIDLPTDALGRPYENPLSLLISWAKDRDSCPSVALRVSGMPPLNALKVGRDPSIIRLSVDGAELCQGNPQYIQTFLHCCSLGYHWGRGSFTPKPAPVTPPTVQPLQQSQTNGGRRPPGYWNETILQLLSDGVPRTGDEIAGLVAEDNRPTPSTVSSVYKALNRLDRQEDVRRAGFRLQKQLWTYRFSTTENPPSNDTSEDDRREAAVKRQ